MGKPPHCEINIKAVSDSPSDFTATISFDDRSSKQTTITRAAKFKSHLDMGQLCKRTCKRINISTGSFCDTVLDSLCSIVTIACMCTIIVYNAFHISTTVFVSVPQCSYS